MRFWKECSAVESELEIDVDEMPTRPDAHRSGVMLSTRMKEYDQHLESVLLGYLFPEDT